MADNRKTGLERSRALRAVGLALVLGLLVTGLPVTLLSDAASAAPEQAPDVTLNTPNGEFRISQQRGKVLLLYFSFPG